MHGKTTRADNGLRSEVVIVIKCPKCKTDNASLAKFCESCGKSFASIHEGDEAVAQMLLSEAKKGSIGLFVVGGIQVIAALLAPDDVTRIVMVIIGVVFAGLGLWARKAPYVASIVGLVVFGGLHLAEMAVDPASIFRGIIMKIIVVTVLINAIRSGVRYRTFQRQRGLAA